ncbi:MAG: hypothetical protein ACTSPD_17285 [Promethearchaeota archaeon]
MTTLPNYRQLPNACGLSSFLMLINPESNLEIKNFLDHAYEHINFLIPRLSLKQNLLDEYKWSVVLVYLLLKCLGDNTLSSNLYDVAPELYDEFRPNLVFNLENDNNKEIRRLPETFKEFYFSFFKEFLVNPYILRRSLYTMRIDRELKILFTLFGGTFIPQEQEIWDGTGALYFSKEDFKSKTNKYKEKLKILEKHLQNSDNKIIPAIIMNLGFHWVAVSSISEKSNTILFNDPATGKTIKVKIGKRFPESCRFYLFNYNPESALILKKEIKEFLNNEFEKELNQVREFTKRLVKDFESPEKISEQLITIKNTKTESVQYSQEVKDQAKPLTGKDLMSKIKSKIREQFSDYSKL